METFCLANRITDAVEHENGGDGLKYKEDVHDAVGPKVADESRGMQALLNDNEEAPVRDVLYDVQNEELRPSLHLHLLLNLLGVSGNEAVDG